MAVFTKSSTTLTINRTWKDVSNKYSYRDITIVLSAQGDATDYIAAAQLDLASIKGSTIAVSSDNTKVYPTTPSYTGAYLLFQKEGSDAPATVTGTFNLTVWGNPATL